MGRFREEAGRFDGRGGAGEGSGSGGPAHPALRHTKPVPGSAERAL